MQTYRVKIGSITAKGHFNEVIDLVVNSKNSLDEIKESYGKKYLGLSVIVSTVEEVFVVNAGNEEKITLEVVETGVKTNHQYNEVSSYDVRINKGDIDNWDELISDINQKLSALHDSEEIFKEAIIKMFNIKSVTSFQRHSDSISFSFRPTAFQFDKQEK